MFWQLQSHELLQTIEGSSPILKLSGYLDSGLVAVASQDRVIRVYDMTTRKLCRRFVGHSREITDIVFSADGRRLFSSSLDCTVRVVDLITGRCISWMMFSSAVLSIAVSHSNQHLCVAQADKRGIYMYVDRSLFETVHIWREPTEPTLVQDSAVLVQGGKLKDEGGDDESDGSEDEYDSASEDSEQEGKGEQEKEEADDDDKILSSLSSKAESLAQKGEGVITLSALPRAYWTTLFYLEAIKRRNKVKMPEMKIKAPFFLPTVVKEGVTPAFPTPEELKILQQSGKRKRGEDGGMRQEEEDVLEAVWGDEDDNGDDGGADDQEEGADGAGRNKKREKKLSSSRIFKSKAVSLPRYHSSCTTI